MKRFLLTVVLISLAIANGYSQPESGIEVSISSGLVFPSSPMTFANYWKTQVGGGLGAGVPLSESITLVGAFEYYRFTLHEKGLSDGFDTRYMRDIWIFSDVVLHPDADPSSVMTGSVNLRLAPSGFSGSLSPYLSAGFGVMRFSLSKIDLPTTSTLTVNGSDISMVAHQSITGGVETVPFFQLGIGMRMEITESSGALLEARSVNGISKGIGTAYVPVTVGFWIKL